MFGSYMNSMVVVSLNTERGTIVQVFSPTKQPLIKICLLLQILNWIIILLSSWESIKLRAIYEVVDHVRDAVQVRLHKVTVVRL